jgi:hypothetical protein
MTTAILLLLAFYAAIYGVSYAYALHQVADLFCGWLVLVLWFTGSWELDKVLNINSADDDDQRDKKRP